MSAGITIADWKARSSGTLVGFFTACLVSGIVLKELMLHHKNHSWWISFPAKPKLNADGIALRDDRGRVDYGAPLIEFTSRQAKDRFTDQVLAALRQAQPQVFAAERVPT